MIKSIQNTVFQIFDNSFEKRQRSRLKVHDFSLFTSNCMAGVIYHRLGLQFQSPTINCFMKDSDYFRFIMNLDHYLGEDIKPYNFDEKCPMGIIDDIPIQFTHYKTFEDGVAAWEKRKKRINYKAMYFILFDTVDGEISEKDIIEFGKIKCANKIVLSKNSYPQYDYVLTIPVRKKDSNKHYMNRNIIGRRRFESTFDYVQWINDGKTTV